MSELEFTDRYKATGTPYPSEDSCDQCDGMGLWPVQTTELNAEARKTANGTLIIIGQIDKDGSPLPDDGWVIVRCSACNGTRRKVTTHDGAK